MDYQSFAPLLGDWGPKLQPFIESDECNKLYTKLKDDRKRGKIICPDGQNVYRAFKETPYNDLKVVFWLLDPYPKIIRSNKGEITKVADGIAMSCAITEKFQPSLELFYDAMEDDLHKGLKLDYERFYDLKYLCNQGIMLLNTALTVEAEKTGSHTAVWRPFMQYLCEEVFAKYNNGLIFVLCGKASQEMARWINPLQHYIFNLEHPAFAARQMRKWDHQQIFSKINALLKENNDFLPVWMYETLPF